ncbi:cysteine-rich receptor-like protein kinase 8 [Carex rostrata]
MQSITPCFIALFLINLCLNLASAYDDLYQFCNSSNNYTVNSAYSFNLDELFSSLSTEAVAIQGFSKNITGAAPDQTYGLVLCRGDVNSSVCGDCLNQSVGDVMNLCPYSKEATIYYDYCLLSYSNQQFLNSTDNSHQIIMYNTQNVTGGRFSGWDPSNNTVKTYFNTVVNTLLSTVSDQAAYNSIKRFGTGVINLTGSLPVIYGLSQCTPDFSNNTCRACLQNLINETLNYFDGRQGGRIIGVRCNLRYEIYTFFSGKPDQEIGYISGTETSTPPMNSPSSTSKGGRSRRLIIIISVSVASLIIVCFLVFLLIRKKRCAETEISQEERMLTTNNETLDLWSRETNSDFPFFDFNQIATATGNFSLDNKLGEGGFGPVYKGVLQDGLEIAVKRLSSYSGQGLVEFKNEIQLIAKLQHRNLVRLVGWCIQGEEKILIYEFMPNKSLDYFIFDETRGELLNWERRFEIIEGIAQGLLYLHKHSRLRIVHRDLKASNILLDSEMNPKISDFGLARIFSAKDQLQANTNRVVGTYGYMAPEYASEGLFSIKSDVFSFGVLLLEIISGKRNIGFNQYGDFLNLLGYAWDRWKGRNIAELISLVLTEAPHRQIERCIHVSLLCVQENPADRPTMSDVIVFLTTASITLPEPKQPAYFNVRITEKGVESSDFFGSSCSINDVTLTNPDVR